MFLGRSVTQHKSVSDETAHTIDEEVRYFIESNYDRAKKILDKNTDKLHMMAEALMKYETIDADQIDDIMDGRKPKPPKDWTDDSEAKASGGGDAEATPEEGDEDDKGTIGDPAGQH